MTMKNPKTTWTSPTANILIAANMLRKCLASGYKGRIIRILNEDCEHPILLDKNELSKDFREYDFSYGNLRTRAEIIADTSMSEFEKTLSLEYHVRFGTEEAVKQYYETGVLSDDNFISIGVGKCHLVKVSDMIEFYMKSEDIRDHIYAKLFSHYTDEEDSVHFYDRFTLKSAQYRTPKHFNHKLYAVEMLDKDLPDVKTLSPWYIRILMAIISIVVIPLKFIPEKSILRMPEYILYRFRIGSVTNVYSVEFQIPKKFQMRD